MVQNALVHWKTSTAGVILGAAFLVALGAYKPGMTVGQWSSAAVGAILLALPGILAHDAGK